MWKDYEPNTFPPPKRNLGEKLKIAARKIWDRMIAKLDEFVEEDSIQENKPEITLENMKAAMEKWKADGGMEKYKIRIDRKRAIEVMRGKISKDNTSLQIASDIMGAASAVRLVIPELVDALIASDAYDKSDQSDIEKLFDGLRGDSEYILHNGYFYIRRKEYTVPPQPKVTHTKEFDKAWKYPCEGPGCERNVFAYESLCHKCKQEREARNIKELVIFVETELKDCIEFPYQVTALQHKTMAEAFRTVLKKIGKVWHIKDFKELTNEKILEAEKQWQEKLKELKYNEILKKREELNGTEGNTSADKVRAV